MFFKKKVKAVESKEIDTEAIKKEIDNLRTVLKDDFSKEHLVKLAALENDLGNTLTSIELLEDYMNNNKELGIVLNELMKYYNIMVKKCASEKDDEKLQNYLSKTDNLMQMSKDIIRGKY